MKIKSLIIAIVLGYPVAAEAAVIVQWGEPGGAMDIVTANTTGSLTTTYTDGASINPTVGASYYPNATGRTPTYNGAHETSGNTHPVQDRTTPADRMFINGNPGSGGIESMITWEDGIHMLSSTAGLTLGTFTWAGQLRSSNDAGSIRFLLEDSAGQWHISQSFSITAAPGTATELDTVTQSASGLSWSLYTPFVAGVDTIGGGSAPSLTSVQSAGFFTDVSGTISNTGMAMEYFQVTAVPEPSTLVLSAFGLLSLGFVGWRRRRR